MTQESLDQALARNTDPETSHEAAGSVVRIPEKQYAVYRVLLAIQPATDVDLVSAYKWTHGVPPQSESGIRTRRSELVRDGRVIDTGERVTLKSGRRAILWAVNGL